MKKDRLQEIRKDALKEEHQKKQQAIKQAEEDVKLEDIGEEDDYEPTPKASTIEKFVGKGADISEKVSHLRATTEGPLVEHEKIDPEIGPLPVLEDDD